MSQPRHCYSSLNTTIHHRAQKRFAADKVFSPRQPADGVFPPQSPGVLASAVSGSCERRDDHAAAGQAGAGESPAGSLSLAGCLADAVARSAGAAGPSLRCACECPPGRPGTMRRRGCASGDRPRSGPVASIRVHWPFRISSGRGVAGPGSELTGLRGPGCGARTDCRREQAHWVTYRRAPLAVPAMLPVITTVTYGGKTRQVAWAEETAQLKDCGDARPADGPAAPRAQRRALAIGPPQRLPAR